MYTFKKGDTFLHNGQLLDKGLVIDLTGWTARAQIRAADVDDTKIQELTATITDGPTATVQVFASAAQTAAWTYTGDAFMDIQLTATDGTKWSTPPLSLTIIAGVTHD